MIRTSCHGTHPASSASTPRYADPWSVGADDKSTSMLLPSIDLDDPFLHPQAPSMALASHSTSAGSHPLAGPSPAGQVFAAPQHFPGLNTPAADQYIPGPEMSQPAEPPADAPQQENVPRQRVFATSGPDEEGVPAAPPQSAAHSTAHEVRLLSGGCLCAAVIKQEGLLTCAPTAAAAICSALFCASCCMFDAGQRCLTRAVSSAA